jgi:hypothetical protein
MDIDMLTNMGGKGHLDNIAGMRSTSSLTAQPEAIKTTLDLCAWTEGPKDRKTLTPQALRTFDAVI